MIGTTISHYRIIRQLGMGGMGVVYAAEDPRLKRQVALKFVPEELTHDTRALERLRSEARTASSLNHPNICTIYDIGEHEGRPFIVMELLSGITLRERMSARPLKLHEVVDIGIQVSDALYWAHSKDIIHRDIKPANLFLVDQGPVKVLDFGLAKVVASDPSDATVAPTIDLTAVGVAVGTVAYMSPEQVSGETLDRRTDLFSTGVVLYECVTGQLPFTGKTSAVILASILTQSPAPAATLNAGVPVSLQDVINKCLEKDRELRYQDAAGLRADLKRIKRDIESGALKAMGAAAARATGSVPVPELADQSTVAVSRPAVPSAAVSSSADTTRVQTVAAAPGMSRGLVLGLGVGALVAAGLVFFLMSGRQTAPESEAATVASPAAPAPAAPVLAAPPAQEPPTTPAVPAAAADSSRARFDEAILDANRLLAAGDTDGATRALNTARAVDPGAPAVAELSSRLVERFRSIDARRTPSEPARTQPASRTPTPVDPPAQARSGAQPGARGNAPVQTTAAPPPPVVAQAPPLAPEPPPQAAPPPVAVAPAPAPRPAEPAPAPPERRAPVAPAPPVEDDDALIRRAVAAYARAIEQKDIALFRSVKPNLSSDEQRRIEEGFRAVTSQKVDVTILSVERRGQEASVRLRRRDTIQAGGRQQIADTQQTLVLTKAAVGWVIRDIGR